ncbi:hypothetical protein K8I31_07465, partial [bacterium]|nr:hypothetical protein [bacterium]
LQWGKTKDGIGFISIQTWSDQSVPGKVDEFMEELKDTKAMIVDVRLNGGGGEPLAQQVAGRFVDQERVYAFSQYRSGPKHDNLTRKYERKFGPTGDWQYQKPVITLIGQRCMSSNEAFVKMMGECPNVTLMGEATRGSSGNPKRLELPMGISVSVPQWIDYRADGKTLEGNGVDPDVEFKVEENEYGSIKDSLLEAALKRIRNL